MRTGMAALQSAYIYDVRERIELHDFWRFFEKVFRAGVERRELRAFY
jgi:hypothetical protein